MSAESPQAAASALAYGSAARFAYPSLAASGLCPANVLRMPLRLPLEAPEGEQMKKEQQWGGTYSRLSAQEAPL